eukprot:593993-Amphidinium_carterae.1
MDASDTDHLHRWIYAANWTNGPLYSTVEMDFLKHFLSKTLPSTSAIRTLDKLLERPSPYKKKHKSGLAHATCVTASTSAFPYPVKGEKCYSHNLGPLAIRGGSWRSSSWTA